MHALPPTTIGPPSSSSDSYSGPSEIPLVFRLVSRDVWIRTRVPVMATFHDVKEDVLRKMGMPLDVDFTSAQLAAVEKQCKAGKDAKSDVHHPCLPFTVPKAFIAMMPKSPPAPAVAPTVPSARSAAPPPKLIGITRALSRHASAPPSDGSGGTTPTSRSVSWGISRKGRKDRTTSGASSAASSRRLLAAPAAPSALSSPSDAPTSPTFAPLTVSHTTTSAITTASDPLRQRAHSHRPQPQPQPQQPTPRVRASLTNLRSTLPTSFSGRPPAAQSSGDNVEPFSSGPTPHLHPAALPASDAEDDSAGLGLGLGLDLERVTARAETPSSLISASVSSSSFDARSIISISTVPTEHVSSPKPPAAGPMTATAVGVDGEEEGKKRSSSSLLSRVARTTGAGMARTSPSPSPSSSVASLVSLALPLEAGDDDDDNMPKAAAHRSPNAHWQGQGGSAPVPVPVPGQQAFDRSPSTARPGRHRRRRSPHPRSTASSDQVRLRLENDEWGDGEVWTHLAAERHGEGSPFPSPVLVLGGEGAGVGDELFNGGYAYSDTDLSVVDDGDGDEPSERERERAVATSRSPLGLFASPSLSLGVGGGAEETPDDESLHRSPPNFSLPNPRERAKIALAVADTAPTIPGPARWEREGGGEGEGEGEGEEGEEGEGEGEGEEEWDEQGAGDETVVFSSTPRAAAPAAAQTAPPLPRAPMAKSEPTTTATTTTTTTTTTAPSQPQPRRVAPTASLEKMAGTRKVDTTPSRRRGVTSNSFGVYSFSNGHLMDEWRTVAAARTRPFELFELHPRSEYVRIPHHQYVQPYFDGYFYVFKARSASAKVQRAGLGVWKLRWIVVQGSRLYLFRNKKCTSCLAAVHLSLIKWLSTEKVDAKVSSSILIPGSLSNQVINVAFATHVSNLGDAGLHVRSLTAFDHDQLYGVLGRTHYRWAAERTQASMEEHHWRRGRSNWMGPSVPEGEPSSFTWREMAVARATLAGRGGLVVPGQRGRKGGRNALCRHNIVSGPNGWDDADRWESDSADEDSFYAPGLFAGSGTVKTRSTGDDVRGDMSGYDYFGVADDSVSATSPPASTTGAPYALKCKSKSKPSLPSKSASPAATLTTRFRSTGGYDYYGVAELDAATPTATATGTSASKAKAKGKDKD